MPQNIKLSRKLHIYVGVIVQHNSRVISKIESVAIVVLLLYCVLAHLFLVLFETTTQNHNLFSNI